MKTTRGQFVSMEANRVSALIVLKCLELHHIQQITVREVVTALNTEAGEAAAGPQVKVENILNCERGWGQERYDKKKLQGGWWECWCLLTSSGSSDFIRSPGAPQSPWRPKFQDGPFWVTWDLCDTVFQHQFLKELCLQTQECVHVFIWVSPCWTNMATPQRPPGFIFVLFSVWAKSDQLVLGFSCTTSSTWGVNIMELDRTLLWSENFLFKSYVISLFNETF